jgi:hypothetical protein
MCELGKPLNSRYVPPERKKGGVLTAWRICRVRKDNVLLSISTPRQWKPGCSMSTDIPVTMHNGPRVGVRRPWQRPAGVHAWKSRKLAIDAKREHQRYRGPGTRPGIPVAIVRVRLSGRVIEHQNGYRATYGRITAIIGPTWFSEAASRYRVKLLAPSKR